MIKFQNREPLMPSPQFIKSYFSSFTDDIISQPMLKGEKSDEDKDKEGEALEVKEKYVCQACYALNVGICFCWDCLFLAILEPK
jgi:hypothetical protein